MTPGERSPGLATRRLFATATDYGMVTLPLAAMLGARIALGSRGGQALAWPPSAEAARTAQWAVPALLTIPVAVGLGAADARGGTPGKRVAGLAVRRADGSSPTSAQAVARALVKTALPWELGHQAVVAFATGHERRGATLAVAAHALMLAHCVCVWRGLRPLADVVAGTRVDAA